MPRVVAIAAALQYLQAVAFLVQSTLAYRRGTNAQQAADAAVAKQGLPATTLSQHGVRFAESRAELLLPVAIAVCLATLASLNLAGVEIGRILSWILQPILLVAGGWVTANQVFATRFLTAAFRKSDDLVLRRIDVNAFVDAAMSVFPRWFRSLVAIRFVLITFGSALVILLLAMPTAGRHFH